MTEKTVIVPRGFSNTFIIGSDKKILFQLRDGHVPYPKHYSPWGGAHKQGVYAPRAEAIRELRSEIPDIDFFLDQPLEQRLEGYGVWVLPLPRANEPQHNCEQLTSQGYTDWVNWMYRLRVQSAQDIADSYDENPLFEGEPVVVSIDDFESGNLDTPIMSEYAQIISHELGRRNTTLPHAWTFKHLYTILKEIKRVDVSAFDPYMAHVCDALSGD